MRLVLTAFVVFGTLCVARVTPLAAEGSFRRRFQECRPEFRQQDSVNIPPGMTIYSFIDTVERLEKKYFKSARNAPLSALTFLRWFSWPDIDFTENEDKLYQTQSGRKRFELIQKLFERQLGPQSDIPIEPPLSEFDSDTVSERRRDECFMMQALSHTYRRICPEMERNALGGNNVWKETSRAVDRAQDNRQYSTRENSLRNQHHQTGQAAARFDEGSRPRMRSQASSVPNIRNAQARLSSSAQSIDATCEQEELGVLSVSGHAYDAVSIAPVLIGMAASTIKDNDAFKQFVIERHEMRSVYGDRLEVDPIVLATVGQELGYAAYRKSAKELERSKNEWNTYENDAIGKWNQTGCLSRFILTSRGNIAFSRAQITGAIDGLILGNRLLEGQLLADMSLADILRLYYNSQEMMSGSRSQLDILSVCNRQMLYRSFRDEKILSQARLVASVLSAEDGTIDDMNDVNGNLAESLRAVVTDRLPKGSSDELCPDNNNLERCSNPADLFVILDPSAPSRESRDLQANILGRIVNGMEFRRQRNSIRIYYGSSGSRLRLALQADRELRQTDVEGFTASGSPACIAQNALPDSGTRPIGERELFIAVNGTLNYVKEQAPSDLPRAGQVVVYFRMSAEPVQDAQSAAEALIGLRIAHPELKVIAIGDENALEEISKYSAGLYIYPLVELKSEIMQEEAKRSWNDESRFSRLRRTICESAIQLSQGFLCSRRNSAALNQVSRGSRMRKLSFGVDSGHVKFVSFDSDFVATRNRFDVQFSSDANGEIKVCELASDYQYATLDSWDGNGNKENRAVFTRYCKATNSSSKSLKFSYGKRCIGEPRSCALLWYAVVGRSSSAASARCFDPFCESPLSVVWSIDAENSACSSTSTTLLPSMLIIGLSLIAVIRLV